MMIINGKGEQIQVCNLLILNAKNVAWLNWHVARHLSKNIEISQKKIGGGGGGLATLRLCSPEGLLNL